MASIIVVDYRPEHLEKLSVKKIHQGEIPKTIMTVALTLLRDGLPIAIVGGFLFTPGALHLWALISDEVRRVPIAFHKACLELLLFIEETHHPRRIQMDVRVSYLEGQKWAESLGFLREGIMRKYAPDGEDAFLYARVA